MFKYFLKSCPRYRLLWILLVVLSENFPAAADSPYANAVASADPQATAAGMAVLAAGGNAFDAAVAVTALLAVVEPTSSGLGGGGFWLLHQARDGSNIMLDGRETAPAGAGRNLYLDASGDVIPNLSVDGALAAAIPGTPAALVRLAQHYGKWTLARSLAPAIKIARDGFMAQAPYRDMAEFRLKALQASVDAAHIFLANGQVPVAGTVIRQPDLAMTLEALAKNGTSGFYEGPVAAQLVRAVRAAGGIWTADDLAHYRIIERAPVVGHYHNMTIFSASPPSSGGVALVTMLNILAGFDLAQMPAATRDHVIIEAMRRAYRDRADYLGDPDFVAVDTAGLTDPRYAAGLRAGIRLDMATPSESLPGHAEPPVALHTTHFSILDRAGNRVSATMSINFPFGSGVVAAKTGVLLNDEMDDFSAKPGAPNVYGLVGGDANAIAPGKRPLSSMTPTFLENERGTAILGTPGGSRIITMVLLAALDFAAGGGPDSWVTLKRFHHQFLPDVVQYEPGALDADTIDKLHKMGHTLEEVHDAYGNMQAILWDRVNGVSAASDPRGIGSAKTER